MRKILIVLGVICLAGCRPSADEQAAPLMSRIDSLYEHKAYAQTLTAIRELRAKHPEAVEARRRALKIWQEASLKMTQEDIGRTDSALQAALAAYRQAATPATRNKLKMTCDSLQIRYDALCGTVRVIHKRQAER